MLYLDGEEKHLAMTRAVLDKHPLFRDYVANIREKHFKEYFETQIVYPDI